MYVSLSERERHSFFHQTDGCHIPGYTGHCPTLKFQYGTSYGAKTREILQDLRDKHIVKSVQRTPYRHHNDHDRAVLQPIVRSRGQTAEPITEYRNRASKYIIGYTGFIPTLNFRYGKSFGKAADDSVCEFSTKQRRSHEQRLDADRLRARSAPKFNSIRNADDVKHVLREKEENRFKERQVSAEFPPIAGYTGYIPKVKGNEESLSQRYNNVVKRSLTLLREERENNVRNLDEKRRYVTRNKDEEIRLGIQPQHDYKDYKS